MKNEEEKYNKNEVNNFEEEFEPVSQPPSFFRVMRKEIYRDKLAFISLIILTILLLVVFIGAPFYNVGDVIKVDLKNISKPWFDKFLLGTDPSGRDMIGQLLVGARNSFVIAFGVTILCAIVGILVGLVAGFYAGKVDNAIMRIIDFIMMLPSTMLIIVIISIIPKYNAITFILIMSMFGWTGKARLIRAKTLQQSNLDYVSASKTLGTRGIVIMFREVIPNISSIIIVNLTLTLAANMGLETGLTFLGYGLPSNTPSLGTLLSYAAVPENMQNRPWQWLPAIIIILIMMLCINFVGQAINRASDTKQKAS